MDLPHGGPARRRPTAVQEVVDSDSSAPSDASSDEERTTKHRSALSSKPLHSSDSERLRYEEQMQRRSQQHTRCAHPARGSHSTPAATVACFPPALGF